MKLTKLKLFSDFRSLKSPFEISFRNSNEVYSLEEGWNEFHPFCLVGLNGSGKSNVLEVLANIFYHLENCVNVNQPSNFQSIFNYNECEPNEFELEYFIVPKSKLETKYITKENYTFDNLVKVLITKQNNMPPIVETEKFPFDGKSLENQRIKPTDSEIRERQPAPAKAYLPNLIIGYSSGENETLSTSFMKTRLLQYDEYKECLIKNYKYDTPESSLIYIDYEMSQAVLLTNLIFNEHLENEVLTPIRQELGILDVTRFRINLHKYNFKEYNVLGQLIKEDNKQDDKDKIIDKLKNCCTCFFESEDNLTLDFWVNEATKKSFKYNFTDVFDLFQAFQLLYNLNYHTVSDSIKSDIYKAKGNQENKENINNISNKVFYFSDFYIQKRIKNTEEIVNLFLRDLSDGEQQFLHTIGICLMLNNRNALLLLDEPETHFNPDWRSKFIRILKNSLEASNSNNLMSDIIITSHSPFIISDCTSNRVLIFSRDKDGKLMAKKASELGIHTFGTSIHILTNKVFEKKESIADYSLGLLNHYKYRKINGEPLEKLIREINETHGDSIEKLLLINELKQI